MNSSLPYFLRNKVIDSGLNEVRYWKPNLPLTGSFYSIGRIGCLDEDTEILIINEKGEIESKKIKDV